MTKLLVGLFAALMCLFGAAGTVAETAAAPAAEEVFKTDSFSAYLTDYGTGTVLYESNADEKHEIASMTKIMTLVLAFEEIEKENLTLDTEISISDTAAKTGGSTMFLDANTSHKVEGLLKGIIIASANDGAVALAEKIAGTEDEFVSKMNAKAQELGMTNTRFVNCTGLPKDGQYSTAKDVNIMTRELCRHNVYYKYSRIWMEDYTHPSGRVSGLTNTNKLVRFYQGCDGGKTGYTDKAKHCLSASATRNGLKVVGTVIGAPDSKTRFRDVSSMFDYAFANYENALIVKGGENLIENFDVGNSKNTEYSIGTQKDVNLLSKKGQAKPEHEIVLDENVKAPLAAGSRVGTLLVKRGDETVMEQEIITLTDIEKAGFADWFKRIAKKW